MTAERNGEDARTTPQWMRLLAWALGIAGTLACTLAGAVVIGLDAPASFLVIILGGVLLGLLGGLVASREPRNSIGWLMCGASLAASLTHLPAGYAYAALVLAHGTLPLGPAAVWLGAWSWVPALAFLPVISVRFPHGKALRGWWIVDWLSIAGVGLFALAIALGPPARLVTFMPIPGAKVAQLLPYAPSPFGTPLAPGALAQIQGLGLTLLVLGFVAAAASLAARFRQASDDEKLQLKWFAYSGSLIAASFVFGAVAWNFLGWFLYEALTPLEFAALTFPIAIAVAVLRYHLYDIDLIINRTIVYVGLTALLAAGYTAGVTFFQRLFISLSGQKSDAAYVLTAFAIVVGFSPLKDWLQHQVDRRVARVRASAALDQFRNGVDAVVSVMDMHRIACRFLDEAVVAFDARGASIYLETEEPVYNRGRLNGGPCVEVPIRSGGRQLGRLLLAERRGNATYAERDRAALQRSADSVGEALAMSARLRRKPLPESD